MQIVDHCTIYFLIAGTYTVIVLSAIRPRYPVLGWGLFAFEWAMAALATTLTAIDLKKYNVISMICYIGLGWAIIPFARQALEVLTLPGFLFLLLGESPTLSARCFTASAAGRNGCTRCSTFLWCWEAFCNSSPYCCTQSDYQRFVYRFSTIA